MEFDLLSFVGGIVLTAILVVLTGFGSELGKDIYSSIKKRVKEPEPLKVSKGYVAQAYLPSKCRWVVEEETLDLQDSGYIFYPHSKNRGGKCYREVMHGNRLAREYLMVKPQND